jgi:hypothetical protein
VRVAPISPSGSVGESAQFTATALDAAGNVLTGRATIWSSSNASVVTVSATGYVVAVGPGVAMIAALVDTATGSTVVTVTGSASTPAPPPPPPPPPPATPSPPATPVVEPMPVLPEPVFRAGTGTLLWQDSFDGLLGDVTMLLNYVGMQASFLHADAGGGLGGSGAMRMDWTRSTSCQDDWRGIERSLAGAPREVIVQYSVRYSPGFVFDWAYSGQSPCDGNAKKFMRLVAGTSGGAPCGTAAGADFLFVSEDHDLRAEGICASRLSSQNVGAPTSLSELADGKWHRVTFHVKQSSSLTAADGFFHGWIDGVQRWSMPNWASRSVGGWGFLRLPGTFNRGSPATQSEWLDDLKIWRP